MSFYARNFIFDGIPSETYGLIIDSTESGESSDSTASNEVDIKIQEVYRRAVPYFYGVQQTPVLEFDVSFTTTQGEITAEDSALIQKWLFGQMTYKKLRIVQPDMQDYYFNCFLNTPSIIRVGNIIRGFKCTVVCDSPFAYGEKRTLNLINGNNNFLTDEVKYIQNLSENNYYTYPENLQIEMSNSLLTPVEITGDNFADDSAGIKVEIGSEKNKTNTTTKINLTIDENLATTETLSNVKITNVTSGDYVISPYGFSYGSGTAPVITSISSFYASIHGNKEITITGKNFKNPCTVSIGGKEVFCRYVSQTELIIYTPVVSAIAEKLTIMVKNPDGETGVHDTAFAYTNATDPYIINIIPEVGAITSNPDTTDLFNYVKLIGKNFSSPGLTYYFKFDGTTLTSAKNNLTITTNVSYDNENVDIVEFYAPNSGSEKISDISITYENTNIVPSEKITIYYPNSYIYNATDTVSITSVSPSYGAYDQNTPTYITINGDNFSDNISVSFGEARPATIVDGTNTGQSLTVSLPSNASTNEIVDIILEDGDYTAVLKNGFIYDYTVPAIVPTLSPTITSITPDNGYNGGGTIITIVGTKFTPYSTVVINNVEAVSKYKDSKHLSCILPSSISTSIVQLKVKNGIAESNSKDFTYNTTGVKIGSLSSYFSLTQAPDSSVTKIITVTGCSSISSLSDVNVIMEEKLLSTSDLSLDNTSFTFQIPAMTEEKPISLYFTINNIPLIPSEVTNFDYFSVRQNLAPSISSISNVYEKITITGSNYDSSTTVTFKSQSNSYPVLNFLSKTSTSLTFVYPDAGSYEGPVDVIVTNSSSPDNSAIMFDGFVYRQTTAQASIKNKVIASQIVSIVGKNFKRSSTVTINSGGKQNKIIYPKYISPNNLEIIMPPNTGKFPTIKVGNQVKATGFKYASEKPTELYSRLNPGGLRYNASTGNIEIHGENLNINSIIATNIKFNGVSLDINTTLTKDIEFGKYITFQSMYFPSTVSNPITLTIDYRINGLARMPLNTISIRNVYLKDINYPIIYTIEPERGPFEGGTALTIKGKYFSNPSKVFIKDVSIVNKDGTVSISDVECDTVYIDSETLQCVTKNVGQPETKLLYVKSINDDVTTDIKSNKLSESKTYTISNSTINLNLHGFSIGTKIKFTTSGSSFPTGINGNTTYYVVEKDFNKNSFKISNVLGGEALTISEYVGNEIQKLEEIIPNFQFTEVSAISTELYDFYPKMGHPEGNTLIDIYGNNFSNPTYVSFDDNDNIGIKANYIDEKHISCISPSGVIGESIPIRIKGSYTISTNNNSGFINFDNSRFHYVKAREPYITSISPATGSKYGGTEVTIIGGNFPIPALLKIRDNGSTEYVSPYIISNTTNKIVFVTPLKTETLPHSTGQATIKITGVYGTEITNSSDFSYETNTAPVIYTITPNQSLNKNVSKIVSIINETDDGREVKFGDTDGNGGLNFGEIVKMNNDIQVISFVDSSGNSVNSGGIALDRFNFTTGIKFFRLLPDLNKIKISGNIKNLKLEYVPLKRMT